MTFIRNTFFVLLSLMCSVMAYAHTGLPDFTDLIEKTSPAVVKIHTKTKASQLRTQQFQNHQNIPEIFRHLLDPRNLPEREAQSMGSGFIVSDDGYILTNHHVINGADEITVRLMDRREFVAQVIGTDERSDLSLLKINQKHLPTLTLAAKKDLRVGEWVVAIGSPFGLEFSASAGIVSAIGRSIPSSKKDNYVPFIQTDVAINPGHSGGPLFNLNGEVVGINSQIYTQSGGSIGLSFAIPAHVAIDVIAQLKEKGRVERGWLGVVIQEVDKNLAESFGLERPKGALVVQMDHRGPAAEGGIKDGDIIIKFGAVDIVTSGDLPHAVGAVLPGKRIPVTVIRAGKPLLLNVKVGVLGGAANDSLSNNGTKTDRLGLLVKELDEELRQSWQLNGHGVMVVQVRPGSPAAKAGLRSGDVIAQLGFTQVESLTQFSEQVKNLPTDSLLPIRFFRKGRPIFRTVIIEQ